MLDESAWQKLCEQNGPEFAERVHIPGLIQRPGVIADLILEAVRAATTRVDDDDSDLPTMRAFRGTCLDYDASEKLMSGAFPGSPARARSGGGGRSEIHSWLSERGGNDDICLAINGVETWDVELAELLYTRFIVPLESAGVPLTRGVDWYCFVAGTGTTPFGVHTDAEPSFIFNLGPATKTAWTWPKSSLSVLKHGRPRTLDAEPLLPAADSACLAPGDFLLIPAGMYHIFRNDGPSMFLGLTVYPEDPEQTATDALFHQLRRNSGRRSAADPVASAIGAFRDVLGDDSVERAVKRGAMLRRSSGYGAPPRFPGRTIDQGPPYTVTRLPIVMAGKSVFALGRELSIDLGGLADLLKPGAVVGADELRDAATTPEREAAVHALIRVGVLRSVGTPQ
ncbi:cupin domain-containing protein [Nonomuraea zeae]|uniref:Cupin domain-containing protein n=1 Tax=Nonomuraea zeae TaxID=1642303 RepID=A0A5S4FBM4_9ACTN|nr:cupin domain-containing protein [Nonomuraea zeae]TMR15052.1 cupin domain-containing protein [Nonomuraea zeae]